MVAGLAGLFGLGLLSPRIERGAFGGLDAEPNIAPLGAGVAELVQVGSAAGVAQAGGTRHADAPLGLQAQPGLPGGDVVGPQIGLCLVWLWRRGVGQQAKELQRGVKLGGGGFIGGLVELAAGPQASGRC